MLKVEQCAERNNDEQPIFRSGANGTLQNYSMIPIWHQVLLLLAMCVVWYVATMPIFARLISDLQFFSPKLESTEIEARSRFARATGFAMCAAIPFYERLIEPYNWIAAAAAAITTYLLTQKIFRAKQA